MRDAHGRWERWKRARHNITRGHRVTALRYIGAGTIPSGEVRAMTLSGCPSRDELAAFGTGRLSGPAFAAIAQHVEQCAPCESALQALDTADDPLVSRLRHMPRLAPTPVPKELVAAARCLRDMAAPIPPNVADGCRLGRFQLVEQIGAGSYGRVFRARDTELD